MALSRLVSRRSGSATRALQIRVRGLGDQFAEWETLGALAGLARERDLEVQVEWMLDAGPGGEPAPPRRSAR